MSENVYFKTIGFDRFFSKLPKTQTAMVQKVLDENGNCYSIFASPVVSLPIRAENESRQIQEFIEVLNANGYRIVPEHEIDPKILKREKEAKLRQEHPTCFLTEEQRENMAQGFREKFKEELEELARLKEDIQQKRSQKKEASLAPVEEMIQSLRGHVYLSYTKSMEDYLDYCQETASTEEFMDICAVINERLKQLQTMKIEDIIQQAKVYHTALQERKERFKSTES